MSDGTFTYGLSPGGRTLSVSDGTDSWLAGQNRHGDLTHLFTTAGVIADSKLYDPFGDVVGSSGAVDPSLGFQSDYTDPTSGDVWMGARWYNPTTAAFLSRDTVFGELSTPVSLNCYTYASNNPLAFWDPDGRIPQSLIDEEIAEWERDKMAATNAATGARFEEINEIETFLTRSDATAEPSSEAAIESVIVTAAENQRQTEGALVDQLAQPAGQLSSLM